MELANESVVGTAPNVHQPGIAKCPTRSSVMAIAASTFTPPGRTPISHLRPPAPTEKRLRPAPASAVNPVIAIWSAPHKRNYISISVRSGWIASCHTRIAIPEGLDRVHAVVLFGIKSSGDGAVRRGEWTFLSGMTALWMGVQNAGKHRSDDAGLVVQVGAWVGASKFEIHDGVSQVGMVIIT